MDIVHTICYSKFMKYPINQKKNQQVKSERGVGVEEIWSDGILVDTVDHPKRPDQKYEIYNLNNYAWVVVVNKRPERYITHFPSRAAKRKYKI